MSLPSSSHPGKSAPEGFTLVEMIIAVVILTVGILAVGGLMSTSVWQTRKADDLTNSTVAALQVLDSLAMADFDSVAEGRYADTVIFGSAVYRVAWQVEAVSDSEVAEGNALKKITLFTRGGLTGTSSEPWEMYIFKLGGAS